MPNSTWNNDDFVPSFEEVWADIKPQLDKEEQRRKRKRRFILGWFSFIGVAACIAILYNVNQNNTSVSYAFNHSSVATNNPTAQQTQTSNSTSVKQNASNKKEDANKTQSSKEDNVTGINKNEARLTKQSSPTKTKEKHELLDNQVSASSKQISSQQQTLPIKTTSTLSSDLKIAKNKQLIIASATKNNSSTSLYAVKRNEKTMLTVTNENNKLVAMKPKEDTYIFKPESLVSTTTKHFEINEANTLVNKSVVSGVTSVMNQPVTQTASVAVPKHSKFKLHYGLGLTLPLQTKFNFIDINASEQPLTSLIPQFFVATQIGKKQYLQLTYNPYSQYFLQNQTSISQKTYVNGIIQASGNTIQSSYFEKLNATKLITIELGLHYQYELSKRLLVGAGIMFNSLQGAVLNKTVVKNSSTKIKDELISIDNRDNEWTYLQDKFYSLSFDAKYNYKRYSLGLQIKQPVSSIFNINAQTTTIPLNANLVLQWKIR